MTPHHVFLLIPILFLAGIICLLYWVPRKLNRSKLEKVLSSIVGLLIFSSSVVIFSGGSIITFFHVIILAVFLFLAGITYLVYWIPCKTQHPKLGKILAGIVGLVFFLVTITLSFGGLMFSKKDAEKLMAEQNIMLMDKFEFIEDNSSFAIGDYSHRFTLKISENDKNRIINEIKTSLNYKINKDSIVDFRLKSFAYHEGPKLNQDYETEIEFIKEFLKPEGKGYVL